MICTKSQDAAPPVPPVLRAVALGPALIPYKNERIGPCGAGKVSLVTAGERPRNR